MSKPYALENRWTKATAFATAAFLVMAPNLACGSTSEPETTAPPKQQTADGSLENGTLWEAVVPSDWNGTILLYSHGYLPSFAPIPLTPQMAPDAATQEALLAEGYALVGSSYSTNGWALTSAADDQLQTLDAAVTALEISPIRTLAYGSSMGGLVTGRLAETAGDVFDGAMPTCGLNAGGVDLNNFQLDAAHAINQLLAPEIDIKFNGFDNFDEAGAATGQLTEAVIAAQANPEGQARIALISALHHLPDWEVDAATEPSPEDHSGRQEAMYNWLATTIGFVMPARWDVEVAAGGNATWNAGVDYQELLADSSDLETVRALYQSASLNLDEDLKLLTETANVTAAPGSVDQLNSHSKLTGALKMPVLTIHTTDDNLAPIQFEQEYAEDVQSNDALPLLFQATVARPGHCAFTPAEIVTGIKVLESRVEGEEWELPQENSAAALNDLASTVGNGESAFVDYETGEFLGDR